MNVLISGKDNVFLLSQYIGEFHPAAHLKGLFGCKIIALICNKDLAICLATSISYIMSQKYKVYINNETNIVTENWSDFCANYKIIEAAGGLVFNDKNKILMIFRNGKWDLPKGKIELGELTKDAAIREVEEECGIDNLQIDSKLINTYHTYNLNGVNILKKTYWFKMITSTNKSPKPQINEGITKVEWCDNIRVSICMRNTYATIKDVLNSV